MSLINRLILPCGISWLLSGGVKCSSVTQTGQEPHLTGESEFFF